MDSKHDQERKFKVLILYLFIYIFVGNIFVFLYIVVSLLRAFRFTLLVISSQVNSATRYDVLLHSVCFFVRQSLLRVIFPYVQQLLRNKVCR